MKTRRGFRDQPFGTGPAGQRGALLGRPATALLASVTRSKPSANRVRPRKTAAVEQAEPVRIDDGVAALTQMIETITPRARCPSAAVSTSWRIGSPRARSSLSFTSRCVPKKRTWQQAQGRRRTTPVVQSGLFAGACARRHMTLDRGLRRSHGSTSPRAFSAKCSANSCSASTPITAPSSMLDIWSANYRARSRGPVLAHAQPGRRRRSHRGCDHQRDQSVCAKGSDGPPQPRRRIVPRLERQTATCDPRSSANC